MLELDTVDPDADAVVLLSGRRDRHEGKCSLLVVRYLLHTPIEGLP
jgi:hypothetical protein